MCPSTIKGRWQREFNFGVHYIRIFQSKPSSKKERRHRLRPSLPEFLLSRCVNLFRMYQNSDESPFGGSFRGWV